MVPQFVCDSAWIYVESAFPRKWRGRPPIHQPRQILEAILYIAKTGCQWRLLPNNYPPWQTVYGYFRGWSLSGVLDRILDRLRKRCRHLANKDHRSRIGIIDSQSVKTTRCAATKGFDGKKMIKGRKRHLLVDSIGFLISVIVTRANLHDIEVVACSSIKSRKQQSSAVSGKSTPTVPINPLSVKGFRSKLLRIWREDSPHCHSGGRLKEALLGFSPIGGTRSIMKESAVMRNRGSNSLS